MKTTIAGMLLSQVPAILTLAMLAPGSSHPRVPREPLEYFTEMMPVFTHARCINCHGAVNPGSGVGHPGGIIDTSESCTSSCHSQANNDDRDGLNDWLVPPEELWFVGKDAKALCAQMAQRVMRDGAQRFMDHLQEDLLIDLGFVGRSGGASDDPQAHPPSMSKNEFLVAAAHWMDEGLAACDREATITHTETINSYEHAPLGPIDRHIQQSGRRVVTLRLANGQWTAEVEVRGQITIKQTIRGEVNGVPCETIITNTTDYYDSGPPSGPRGELGNLSAPARVDTKVSSDGSYTLTVHLEQEKHIQADHSNVRGGCGSTLQPSSETLEQKWPATRFVIKGRFPDPRNRTRMVGAKTQVVNQRVGPNDDPWLYDHYAGTAQDGTLFPVTVTTSWNFLYHP